MTKKQPNIKYTCRTKKRIKCYDVQFHGKSEDKVMNFKYIALSTKIA